MASKATPTNLSAGTWKAISLLIGVLLAISSTVLGWLSFGLFDHEVRLTKMEADRFTNKHARELVERQDNKNPKRWVVDNLVDLKARVRELEHRK